MKIFKKSNEILFIIMAATSLLLSACGGSGSSGGGGGVGGAAGISRASISSDAAEGNGNSHSASISQDGSYVVFASLSTNFYSNDTNATNDIFMRDYADGTTILISQATNGAKANGNNVSPDVSSDGRYVVFDSAASSLVQNDTNGLRDIFVRDTQLNETLRVSVSSIGTQTVGGDSTRPVISAGGRFIVFQSSATNLVAGDSNGFTDIFVHDRDTDSDGIFDESGAISTVLISKNILNLQLNDDSNSAAISANGRYVTYATVANNVVGGDTNGSFDVFVHDRDADEDGIYDEATLAATLTSRISVATNGTQALGGSSFGPSISADGRYIAFHSGATNLVASDSNGGRDVFVHDRDADEDGNFNEPVFSVTRVSVSSTEVQGNGRYTWGASISFDGRYVTYHSDSTNLVDNDNNDYYDIFVRDRTMGETRRVSKSQAGVEGDNDSRKPAISMDGSFIVFESDATNLVGGDTNSKQDIFRTPNPLN